ncbi:MAG: carbamoyltransferase [Acidobacteria bacterium]|nr:carbamoyltransferase [Acidobacteriota bacterium]MCZ6753482.1 carbamoyltransferase [Acidobacteriota bacterium]
MADKKSAPNILGISGSNHDAAAALLRGGDLAAALEEEKLVRVRRVPGLPVNAMRYCLEAARLRPEQIDYVALARPVYGESSERGFEEFWIPKRLKQEFPSSKIVVLDHHLCHAAAAYFPSPFEQAAVLTLDGSGDMKTGSLSLARGTVLEPVEDSYFPDSLGNLFSRTAELVGFSASGDEHKLQWLSTCGKPVFAPVFRSMLRREKDSLLSLDQSYFEAGRRDRGGFAEKFFHAAGLDPENPLEESSRSDLAASVQQVLEETVTELCAQLVSRHKVKNLCLAGGVALNALLVEKLETAGLFEGLFVQPAAGNAGNALGAALYCAHSLLGISERSRMEHLYYGPEYSIAEIKDVLENCKLSFRYLRTHNDLVAAAVEELRANRILGWFQGRTEFGPRALGSRSILASPLGPYVSENLNQYVKHREKFRPFAASVTEEHAGEFFECGPMAEFLATVGRVKALHRQTFAANLLDGGLAGEGKPRPPAERIRVHIVKRKSNLLFWELLDAFGKATGVPVLFNTSFNLFGEPLVCSPRDAVRSFYCSGMDHLMIGNFSLSK